MSDPDQESYSLDEMMDRLKSRGGNSAEGEPELVTREDGSQVLKVKKRKRRSHQPHKEEEDRRRKRSLVIASIVAAIVVIGGLGILGWMLHLNSSGYRENVISRISAWTGASVEIRSFRATPVSAAADLMEMTWPEDQPAARLKLNGVRGDLMLSSHLTGVWHGEKMNAASGELVFRKAKGVSEVVSPPDGGLPFRTSFGVSRFKVRFGEGERPALLFVDSSALLSISNPDVPVGNLVLEGGKTRVGAWGVFELDSASLSMSSAGVRVGSISMRPEGDVGGKVRLYGEGFPELSLRGQKSELGFELREMTSTFLLGPKLGSVVEGIFETPEGNTSGRMEVDLTDVNSLRLEGPLVGTPSNDIRLSRLPMFDVLTQVMGNTQFLKPSFESSSGFVFERTKDSARVKDLKLEVHSLMRLRGEIGETKGTLDGELEVGLPEVLLQAVPSRELEMVFHRAEDGYRWGTVTISGTSKKPTDDLEDQILKAMSGNPSGTGGSGGLDDEFRDLTTPNQ